jgi:predicted MFS family arabinose efflux permease
MKRILAVVCLIGFATTLFSRAVEPVVLLIAGDLAVDPTSVALLSSAFSVPFAFIQPVLGPTADMMGKVRVMLICLCVLSVTAVVGAFAPSYSILLVSRIVAGMAAGGIYPVALALVGDLVPMGDRQVVLGRYLAVIMSGNILGTLLSGAVGDLAGWRNVFVVVGCCGIAAFLVATTGLRSMPNDAPGRIDVREAALTYRTIFADARARTCYALVFVEGMAALGVLPYVAVLLETKGEARASLAGIVAAGFALGSIIYAIIVRLLLGKLSVAWIVLSGGCLAGMAMVGIAPAASWPFMCVLFVVFGFGFYMIHGSIQVQATELAPGHRGAATALHSFSFSLGQGLGPVLYGVGFAAIGIPVTLAVGATVMALTGLAGAYALFGGIVKASRQAAPTHTRTEGRGSLPNGRGLQPTGAGQPKLLTGEADGNLTHR